MLSNHGSHNSRSGTVTMTTIVFPYCLVLTVSPVSSSVSYNIPTLTQIMNLEIALYKTCAGCHGSMRWMKCCLMAVVKMALDGGWATDHHPSAQALFRHFGYFKK